MEMVRNNMMSMPLQHFAQNTEERNRPIIVRGGSCR